MMCKLKGGPLAGRRGVLLAALLAGATFAVTSASAAKKVTWPTAAQEIANAGNFNLPFCGTKPITLAILDGIGANAWSQQSFTATRLEAAKCPNVKVTVSAAGGDLQKAISDINSAVAQGAKAIVIVPDFGQSELAAIKQATGAGVSVVPWAADAQGVAGKDFTSYVDYDLKAGGATWAQWMAKALHGKGNVIFLGGPAGNTVGGEQLQGIDGVFKKYPNLHLLTGTNNFAVTNWDPATAQKAVAALLAKYPKIDGVIGNDGGDLTASARAFQAAGRKLVPTVGGESNALSCLFQKAGVPLATMSTRNWMGRVAVRKAIAAAEGLPNKEVAIYNLPLSEDSLGGKALQCNPKAPASYYPSSRLTLAQIAKYGKP
jgi:ribose transport system substrate-binding protein